MTFYNPYNAAARLLKLACCMIAFLASTQTQAQLYLGNGDTLYIGPGEQWFINGNMEVPNGAVLINNATNGINLTGAASIEGEIAYGATGDQHILPYPHRRLSIAGNGSKMLTSDITINDELQLGGNAKLVTGNHFLSINGAAANIAGSSAFGNSASSWIVTGNGNTGADNTGLGGVRIGSIGNVGTVLFPIGPTLFNYTPLTINNSGTTDDFTVAVNDQVVPGADPTKSVRATWYIAEASTGGSIVELGTQWNAQDEASNFIRQACGIVHSNGTTIDYHAAVDAAAGFSPFTRTGMGFTQFSPFGVTSDGLVLPVSFIRLSARLQQQSVQVNWEVAAATHIHHYEVQRSNTNNRFTTIGNVASNGNNANTSAYYFVDAAPGIGDNFYRIKSIGINGQEQFSNIAKVNYAGQPASITAYPNPVTDKTLALDFKNKQAGDYNVNILSNTGALVYHTKLMHSGGNNQYKLSLPSALAREVYQLTVVAPDGSSTQIKLMIHQ